MELGEVVKILENEGKTLFDQDYALPEFMNKNELENQFIAHYYFREIGFETIDRFIMRLNTVWLEKLKEYDIKFRVVHDKLSSDTALNTYEDNLKDKNTFKATPMSSMREGRNYNTTITDLDGKHFGYNTSGNVFRNVNNMIGEHTEVVNSFINEFDWLFMGVL